MLNCMGSKHIYLCVHGKALVYSARSLCPEPVRALYISLYLQIQNTYYFEKVDSHPSIRFPAYSALRACTQQ
jgi:hypothetical protein